jgi:hypothetical protein
MKAMHRTQVYLEQDLVAALQRLARQQGSSMGELIRRGARQLVEAAEQHQPWAASDPVWDLVGMVKGGPPDDGSLNADRYLYAESARGTRMAAERKATYRPSRQRR